MVRVNIFDVKVYIHNKEDMVYIRTIILLFYCCMLLLAFSSPGSNISKKSYDYGLKNMFPIYVIIFSRFTYNRLKRTWKRMYSMPSIQSEVF